MPNCDFYAVAEDLELLLDFVFAQPGWELHELNSMPDHSVRVYSSTSDVIRDWALGEAPCHFQLHAPEMGGAPVYRKIALHAGAVPGASFRYVTDGWGLIQLYFGYLRPKDGLSHSHTNHCSQKRAEALSVGESRFGSPDDWNWGAVSKVSGRINRHIRGLAVDKIGSRPILPSAHETARGGVELLPYG